MLPKDLAFEIVIQVAQNHTFASILLLFYIREIVSPKNSKYYALRAYNYSVDTVYLTAEPHTAALKSIRENGALRAFKL